MANAAGFDAWTAGQSYDHYMGRWSAEVAGRFVDWLGPRPGADWIEAGCGTGALTRAILTRAEPGSVLATDLSDAFASHARAALADPRLRVETADAVSLPAADGSADYAVSGLALNFVPDRAAALAEAWRVLRPGGTLAFYVWDYPAGGIGFIDAFWSAAAGLDPAAGGLDERARFPFCTRGGLADEVTSALGGALGGAPEVTAIEIPTVFDDFAAFWQPFTLGAGPAPGYAASLEPDRREALRASLAERLDRGGPVALTARAWAVRAVR